VDHWCAVAEAAGRLTDVPELPELSYRLHRAFDEVRETWWSVGHVLSGAPTGDLAHMPTGGAYGSDFGAMLAWSRVVAEEAAKPATCLVICDDPWLYRHLATLDSVRGDHAPPLWPRLLRLHLRGLLARMKVAARTAMAVLQLGAQRRRASTGAAYLLVYGHPESNAEGHDAYFGDLMRDMARLQRVLHTDCPPARARELACDGRTFSLHAWGSPLFCLTLPAMRWRLPRLSRHGGLGWLIRRAAAFENSGGGPAMTAWQRHCQARWLAAVKPVAVAWPWENHAWERALCRAARAEKARTIGYQHTVVGPHQLNYSTRTNADGLASIPDIIVANGPAYAAELRAWGVPQDHLVIGGAFRFTRDQGSPHDPRAPLFIALSAVPAISRALIQAGIKAAKAGRHVLVKQHPMYPVNIPEARNVVETTTPLRRQEKLCGVLYSTGTSGLEALLAGLPTIRLIPDDRLALDVLPANFTTASVSLANIEHRLSDLLAQPPRPISWDSVLAEPNLPLWRRLLDDSDGYSSLAMAAK
jgi:hypothetical protein